MTDRLPALTYQINLPRGRTVAVSLAYDNGVLHEMVFVSRAGKEGEELDDMFHELGIKLSRAIQGRDPETGDKHA